MKKIIFIIIAMLLLGCDQRLTGNSFEGTRSRLERAIYMGDLAAVKKIVEKDGFDVNLIISDEYKEKPIHVAAYYGRTDIIEYLVNAGAEIDAESAGGNKTAFLTALWKKHEDTALTLLRLGANPDIKTSSGLSSCERAFRSGLYRVANAIPNCDINALKNRPPCPDAPTPCSRQHNPE